jgi:cell division protein FtsB
MDREVVQAVIAGLGGPLKERFEQQEARIKALEAENAVLRGELLGKVEWLKAAIAEQARSLAATQKDIVAQVLEELGGASPRYANPASPRRLS